MIYDLDLVNALKDVMVKRKMTLAVAESVTSGHLQAAVSAATEASSFFQGGITVYNLGQKTRHLNIEPISALSCDCVDLSVAEQMALEVNRLFVSNYGLATTGYASRVPEKDVHEIFAYYAIADGKKILRSGRISSAKPEGVEVQIDYANQALRILLDAL